MICRIYDVPGATLDPYDAVDRQVGPEAPDGAHVHIAGKTEDGFRVIEVWDSPEHIERFMDSGLAQAILPKRCRRRRFPSRRSPSSRSTSSTGSGADYGPRRRAQAVRGWGMNGPGRTDSMWSTPSRVSTLRTG